MNSFKIQRDLREPLFLISVLPVILKSRYLRDLDVLGVEHCENLPWIFPCSRRQKEVPSGIHSLYPFRFGSKVTQGTSKDRLPFAHLGICVIIKAFGETV